MQKNMASEQLISNVPTKGVLTELLMSRIQHSSFLLRDVNIGLDMLQNSIAVQSLLQPIIVRMVDNERYEIVAGNRRFAACKRLGWKRIMCHVLELDDKDAFEVSLVENLQHNTLNPVEEANAYKRYVEENGWGSVIDLARRIGKSHSYISNRIRLLLMPKEILDQIVCRRTSAGTILEVLAIEDEEERLNMARKAINNDLTREQVRMLLKRRPDEAGVDYISNKYMVSQNELIFHEKEKAIFRFITTLRIALARLDDTLDAVDKEDWILWQNLMLYRTEVHQKIDELIVLKNKTRLHFQKVQSL